MHKDDTHDKENEKLKDMLQSKISDTPFKQVWIVWFDHFH